MRIANPKKNTIAQINTIRTTVLVIYMHTTICLLFVSEPTEEFIADQIEVNRRENCVNNTLKVTLA